MTTYIVSNLVATNKTLAVVAVTWPIRIIRADLAIAGQLQVTRVTGASLSGGTAVTPSPMRQLPGVPAALSTSKNGATVSGTSNDLGTYPTTYQPATDLFIGVGSAFTALVPGTLASSNVEIIYEEVHLARTV